jgi:signal transduction histidine kinase
MSDTPEYVLSTLQLTAEERAALERELLPVARSAALGALTADIGHDLANQIFAALGHVDLLLLDAAPGSPEEQRLRVVKQTVLELKDGLRTLLDYTRPPEGRETAALDDAARQAAELIRHGKAKELQIHATYPGEPVVVRCPPGELTQAALHLLAAARARAGDAGSIDVAVTADGALRVRPAAAGGLGVVAAARIAADNGGSLEHDGESFTLRLPLADRD